MARLCEIVHFSTARPRWRDYCATPTAGILINEHVAADGPTVFAHACRLGAEGIVSKRVDGTYRSGPCPVWIKIRTDFSRQERTDVSILIGRMRQLLKFKMPSPRRSGPRLRSARLRPALAFARPEQPNVTLSRNPPITTAQFFGDGAGTRTLVLGCQHSNLLALPGRVGFQSSF
jgi:hypothetical protein